MDNRKALKERAAARLDAAEAERERGGIILANLGQALQASGLHPSGASAPFAETVDTIAGEIRELEESLRSILSAEERKLLISEEKKNLNVEVRNLRNREDGACENLGRAAWELWKQGRQIHPDIDKALSELIEADEKLHAAEDAVFRSEREPQDRKTFFSGRIKSFLLSGRRRSASAVMDRLWTQSGRRVADIVPSSSFGGTSAAQAAEALGELDRRRASIHARLTTLTAERESLEAALENMPGKGNARRRAAYIEDTLAQRRAALDEAFRNLGRSWLDEGARDTEDEEALRCRDDWNNCMERINTLNAERSAVEAHIAVMDARDKKSAREAEVARLDAEVKERQARLRAARKELSAQEKSILSLEKALPPLPEDLS